MAGNNLADTLVEFSARVQKSKNRLVAIPAAVQRQLGLERRDDNHIIRISLRRSNGGKGRWNHHYVKLTADNEFSIPGDVTGISQGDQLEVKVHRVIPDTPFDPRPATASGWALLLELDQEPREGWRTDGSDRLDDYLNAEIRG